MMALGLLFSRFDLALIGLPLVLATNLIQVNRRPGRTSGEFVTASAPTGGDAIVGMDSDIAVDREANRFRFALSATPGVEAVQIRIFAPGHRPTTILTAPRDIPLNLNSNRTGSQPSYYVQARGYGPFGLQIEEIWTAEAPDTFGLPTAFPLGQMPAPARLRGLTGARGSRRIGEGGDLRDIATMRPGDSLRRVDWRATGRRSPDLNQIYVRRTFSVAEGIAMLVIDSRDDVGPDLATWRGTGQIRPDDLTSLDLARHAAASVAGALIAAGDRVGLEDLAYRRRPVPAATGQRQLKRIQQALALSAPHGEPAEVVRPPRLPADAVIYLFSTLLDDTPLALTAGWIDQGNPVIVVDTLPKVRFGRSEPLALAWRITALERERRVAKFRTLAVPIIPWQSADSVIPAAELTKIARAQARTRLRR